MHIMIKNLPIRRWRHLTRLRILNTLWSDLWIRVTFTSQTSSSLPHLCDNKKFRTRFLSGTRLCYCFLTVESKPRATAEIKFWLTKPFRLGQWRKSRILNFFFSPALFASFKERQFCFGSVIREIKKRDRRWSSQGCGKILVNCEVKVTPVQRSDHQVFKIRSLFECILWWIDKKFWTMCLLYTSSDHLAWSPWP